MNTGLLRHAVATVLTVYGIETIITITFFFNSLKVETVLTVYGIETNQVYIVPGNKQKLQQCLPFTVLKPFVGLIHTLQL